MLKGYDFFVTPVNARETMYCKVCGTQCQVQREVKGPRNWLEAMGRVEVLHDEFTCPHALESWHEQALDLLQEMEQTASQKLRSIMQKELTDLLRSRGKQLPDFAN